MKKLLFLIFCFSFLNVFSQNNDKIYNFETPFYEGVDKWVLVPNDKEDSTFIVGFIYIDTQAGFTFHLKSSVKLTEQGLRLIEEEKDYHVKIRLDRNTRNIYILNPEELNALDLPAEPDWLKIYKNGENNTDYLNRIGYHYNHIGASYLAIPVLEKAYRISPNHKDIPFELAYAYNATNRFDEAIKLLSVAIEKHSKDILLYKELLYALKSKGQLQDAEEVYVKVISIFDDKDMIAEMAYNMAHVYYLNNDKINFDKWAKKVMEHSKEDSSLCRNIDLMNKDLGKRVITN